MKDVSFNILVHERSEFLDMTVWSLKQIKNKDKVKIKFLISADKPGAIDRCMAAGRRLMDAGLDVHARAFTRLAPYNFMDKLRWMVNQPEPYILKVDDDCFAAPQVWDELIESRNCLIDFENVMAVAPSITNGVPTFDYWAETFCNEAERNEIFQMCLDNPCLRRWDIDFSALKPAYEEKQWNPDLYYKLCYQTGEERLGIHPMRFNLKTQERINSIVLDNWEKFLNPPCAMSNYAFPQQRPYFCTSCFLIRKRDYWAIVQNRQLQRDSFEELTFNNWRRMYGKEILFLADAWMIQMYYRSVGNFTLERELYHNIMQRISQ
jgi:hypothetical protein